MATKTKTKSAAEPAAPPSDDISQCQPRGDRVLVQRDMPKTKTEGGILLPDMSQQTKKQYGTVRRVGPGRYGPDGNLIPVDLMPGQRVLLTGYSGMDIEDPNNPTVRDEYVILREEDILATFPA